MRELFKKVRERAHTRDWKSAYTQQTLKCSSQVLRCEEELSHTSSEQQSHSEGLLCKKNDWFAASRWYFDPQEITEINPKS